jgi:type IX secretion system PorP/SprF family membrane protein
MKTNKLLAVLFFGLMGFEAQAQQDPMYTHYMYNTLSINPAYAGSRDALTISALHRSQWVNFRGAPMTQTLTLHTPVGNEHIGLGLAASNDKIGPLNNTTISGSFAYRINLTKKSKLAFGVSGGMHILQADLNSLELDNQNDPSFQNNIRNRVTPSVGFGIYYSRERFYAGVSTPNILESKYYQTSQANGTVTESKAQRHYFFIAGAVFNLTSNLAFKPTTLVKVTLGAPIQADVTASFIMMKRFLLGAMYRTGDAVGVLAGFDITPQFQVGYSFDWSYGLRTATYNSGSHEIMLRYDFIYKDKKQIHSPRYF